VSAAATETTSPAAAPAGDVTRARPLRAARVICVQFGAFAEAERQLAAGGAETFYGQRYSVDFMGRLAGQVEALTVLHVDRDDPEERLPSGVRSLGLQLYPPGRAARHLDLIRALARLRPTHLILQTPLPALIGWALVAGIRVLPILADSFGERSLRARAKAAVLARLLNNRRVEWVANHALAASLELVRIGVSPAKVLPFDWPALLSPDRYAPKPAPIAPELRAIFVGQMAEAKGPGDLIEAVARLAGLGGAGSRPWRATLVGGDNEALARRAAELKIGDRIQFVGRLPHDQIVPLMHEHDAVVVPSWHEYGEGLPMTIFEGLCSRTPLIVSDHRMFRLKVTDGEEALVFPARQPAALAACLDRLSRDGDLYRRLSAAGQAAAGDFFCPLKYDQLISRWLGGTPEDRRELASYCLASGRYQPTLAKRGQDVQAGSGRRN
jgi:glycosyltransferase involved in cell wall biosynthesis